MGLRGSAILIGAVSALAAVGVVRAQCFDAFERPLPPGCGPLLAADFDEDGVMDLLCQQRLADGTNKMIVYYGTSVANPGFQGPYILNQLSPSGRETLALGDFNGDGHKQVAAIQFGATVTLITFTLEVRGQVHIRSSQAVTDGFAIACGDFNNDGRDDIAYAVYDPEPGIEIYLKRTTPGFLAHQFVGTPDYAYPIQAVDFDRDGRKDVVANQQDSCSLLVYLSQPGGAMFPPRWIDRGAFYLTNSFAVADLNGDGRSDMVFGDVLDTSFKVMLSNPDGTYQPRVEYPTVNYEPFEIIPIDWDHDGDIDFVSTDWFVLENRGQGVFAQPYRLTNLPDPLLKSDFNRDGWDDLVCFGPMTIVYTREFTCVADFDCDRFLDFLDLDSFMGAFSSGDVRADIDHDLFLDFFDVDAFIRAFDRGC